MEKQEPQKKNIICFLTVAPAAAFLAFAASLQNDTYDVYVVVDDNRYVVPEVTGVRIIKMEEAECARQGFCGSLLYFYKNKKPCARDKALCYFSTGSFGHLWLVEEDVFVPHVETIAKIDQKYPRGDLLCKRCDGNIIRTPADLRENTKWHWQQIQKTIKCPLPWAATMICAVRVSPRLLAVIAQYAARHKQLFLDEVLFVTLARQAKLNILFIEELSLLNYKDPPIKNMAQINPMYLYHPVKNTALHDTFRKSVVKTSLHF
jgi:hypothetical protein